MRVFINLFSATGTSARIAEAIADGVEMKVPGCVALCNMTYEDAQCSEYAADDLVVVVTPVYGGKMPAVAKQRMSALSGRGTRCISVAVYGNRAFENAATDMAAFMTERGFVVSGAGAFVGEHSYSTPTTPIAEGRPDESDLNDAVKFGKLIGEKLVTGAFKEIEVSELTDEESPEESLKNFRNFVMEYQRSQAENPVSHLPTLDEGKCDECGTCYSVCPTSAIEEGRAGVDASLCIKCCACVKSCPKGARSLFTPFAKPLSENFNKRKSPRWVL